MIDTIIVSGGNIHSDFALDFLKKNEACLIAADKGLEFFLEHQLLPDAVIGDFDSLSEDGKKFLEIQEERSMDHELCNSKRCKADYNPWSDRKQSGSSDGKFRTSCSGKESGSGSNTGGSV